MICLTHKNIKQNNKIDLIATSDFLTQKKIEGKEFNLYLYLSKEENTNELYLIVVSDIETNMVVRFTDKTYNIKINGYPIIIELDKSLVDTGFDVEILEFNLIEKFNNQKKLSSCTIHNYEAVQQFDNFRYEESNNLIVLDNAGSHNNELIKNTIINSNNKYLFIYFHLFLFLSSLSQIVIILYPSFFINSNLFNVLLYNSPNVFLFNGLILF